MPLSKERMKSLSKERRRLAKFQPKLEAFQPKPNWLLNLNRYLLAHMKHCPDYDPDNPGDHFEHCPYVNPLLRREDDNNIT